MMTSDWLLVGFRIDTGQAFTILKPANEGKKKAKIPCEHAAIARVCLTFEGLFEIITNEYTGLSGRFQSTEKGRF